ncbi:MAG TPA: glycosyltransferase family 9 protein [Chloroflexota bacterium]|nr:glycosyltransferase family 9 protein [Chloroflexota bacterium]
MIDERWKAARRILLVRLDNLGDVLVTTPAFHAIATSLPRAELTLLASPVGAQAGYLNPDLGDVIVYEAPWMDPWQRLPQDGDREQAMIRLIKERDFDAAIIFTSFRQSSLPAAYLCYLAGIPLRAAASIDGPGSLLTTRHKHPERPMHEVERGLDLAAAIGCSTDERDLVLKVPEEARQSVRTILRENVSGNPRATNRDNSGEDARSLGLQPVSTPQDAGRSTDTPSVVAPFMGAPPLDENVSLSGDLPRRVPGPTDVVEATGARHPQGVRLQPSLRKADDGALRPVGSESNADAERAKALDCGTTTYGTSMVFDGDGAGRTETELQSLRSTLPGLEVGPEYGSHIPADNRRRGDLRSPAASGGRTAFDGTRNGPIIVVHPGCSMPARTYPWEMFAEAADLLIERLEATVVLTGSEGEAELTARVAERMRREPVDLAGKLSFPELCALIEVADLTVTNNTGPMHLAAAVKTPVIALFALTNPPEQWGPWQVPHRLLYHDVPCRICYSRVCPYTHDCLRLVELADIVAAARDLTAVPLGAAS